VGGLYQEFFSAFNFRVMANAVAEGYQLRMLSETLNTEKN